MSDKEFSEMKDRLNNALAEFIASTEKRRMVTSSLDIEGQIQKALQEYKKLDIKTYDGNDYFGELGLETNQTSIELVITHRPYATNCTYEYITINISEIKEVKIIN
jgi:hypothetical protein